MASLDLKIGDYVHYGAHGVCQVCGQETKKMSGQSRVYFTLRPTGNDKLLLFLPADAEPEKVKLRRLHSKEELIRLIRHAQATPVQWITDSKMRREFFSDILRKGNVCELYRMLQCISGRQDNLAEGKQLPMSDQEMMQAARRQLYSEMACVLAIDENQVQYYIRDQVLQGA